jgi:hypothetical protein
MCSNYTHSNYTHDNRIHNNRTHNNRTHNNHTPSGDMFNDDIHTEENKILSSKRFLKRERIRFLFKRSKDRKTDNLRHIQHSEHRYTSSHFGHATRAKLLECRSKEEKSKLEELLLNRNIRQTSKEEILEDIEILEDSIKNFHEVVTSATDVLRNSGYHNFHDRAEAIYHEKYS